jgi:hypothetical protein
VCRERERGRESQGEDRDEGETSGARGRRTSPGQGRRRAGGGVGEHTGAATHLLEVEDKGKIAHNPLVFGDFPGNCKTEGILIVLGYFDPNFEGLLHQNLSRAKL